MEDEKLGSAPVISREQQSQGEELTRIMNSYMVENNWTATQALNFMRDVLVKSAKVLGVKKHMFDKQCDFMKSDFELFSEISKKSG